MVDEKDKADLLIVMGSSLKVGPVNEIPDALDKSVPAILINRESLRYASEFDGELLGNCDDIVAVLAKKLGWSDFSSDGDVQEVTREDLEKTTEESKCESGDEAPPEKRLKMEKTSEGAVNEEATPVVTRPIRRPKITVPKGVFCKLESGYQTVFHGHELLPEGEDSSSSESEDDEEDEDNESDNGYEDIPESERKSKETQETFQAVCNPTEASGSILTLPEPKVCQNSEEKPL